MFTRKLLYNTIELLDYLKEEEKHVIQNTYRLRKNPAGKYR